MIRIAKFKVILLATILSGCVGHSVVPIAGPWVKHDRRTTIQATLDKAINAEVNMSLAKKRELWKKSHLSSLTYNKKVLLVGQAPSSNLIDEAHLTVSNIQEVEQIYNQITMEEPVPLKQRALDSWITTQLSAKLITNRNIGPNRVKIITENSKVYLMGIVTEDEEKEIISVARNIKGVNQVVKILERLEKTI